MSNKSKSNVIIMKKEYLYFIDLVKMTPMISVTLAKTHVRRQQNSSCDKLTYLISMHTYSI